MNLSNKLLSFGKSFLVTIAIPAIMLTFLLIFTEGKITPESIKLWLQLAISPAILAWGVCFSLKVGMWDFSVGGVIYLSAIIGGNIAKLMGNELLIVITCPITGAVLGLITGLVFRYLRIPSIVVSVGMLLLYECATEFVFGGKGIMLSNKVYVLYTFPYNILIGLISFAIIYFIYNKTAFGYHVRATGNGIGAAAMAGINIDRVRVLCFLCGGLFSGIYAMMNLGSSGVMIPVTNMSSMSMVFEGIICVFIALALERHCNLILGVYVGAFTVQIIKGGILAIGFPTMYQQCIVALFLLIFMSASTRGKELMQSWRTLRAMKKKPEIV